MISTYITSITTSLRRPARICPYLKPLSSQSYPRKGPFGSFCSSQTALAILCCSFPSTLWGVRACQYFSCRNVFLAVPWRFLGLSWRWGWSYSWCPAWGRRGSRGGLVRSCVAVFGWWWWASVACSRCFLSRRWTQWTCSGRGWSSWSFNCWVWDTYSWGHYWLPAGEALRYSILDTQNCYHSVL